MPLQGASPPSEQAGPTLPSSRDSRSTITVPPLLSTSSPPSPSRRPGSSWYNLGTSAPSPQSRSPSSRPTSASIRPPMASLSESPSPPSPTNGAGTSQASQPSGRGGPRQRPNCPTRIGGPGAGPEEGQGDLRGRGASRHRTASKTHRLLRQEDHRPRPGQRARTHGKLILAFIN